MELVAVTLVWALAALVFATSNAFMLAEVVSSRSTDTAMLDEYESTRLSALDFLPEDLRVELISLSKSLEALESNGSPYCSDRVTTLLRGCTKDILSPEDRDEAAMLLTLCDRTRDYVPPMECEGLGTGSDVSDRAAVKRCTIALDQHQNFQRTLDVYRILVIPEKCKSLNGIFNVDPSRETYKNIMVELIEFLQAFARKEAKTEDYFAQWDDRLNAFRDGTADLSTSKSSLMEFNERFVDDLDGMMRVLNMTFEDMAAQNRRTSEEVSSALRDQISRVGEQHGVSLALAVASFETSLSEGLTSIFDVAQERQSNLDLAAAITIKQLMDAVDDLSMARQEFEALGAFVKESTSKAYNQAFLLDKKQHGVSESLTSLGAKINELANTTRELNSSLTDIREDAIVDFNSILRRDTPALQTFDTLRMILRWLGLPPFWALAFLVLSLPRYIIEQTAKAFLWSFAVCFSCVMRVLLGHRKGLNKFDAESNAFGRWRLSSSQSIDKNTHSWDRRDTLPQITYTTCKTNGDATACQQPSLIMNNSRELDKILTLQAALRTRTRITGASRLPSRLYSNS